MPEHMYGGQRTAVSPLLCLCEFGSIVGLACHMANAITHFATSLPPEDWFVFFFETKSHVARIDQNFLS